MGGRGCGGDGDEQARKKGRTKLLERDASQHAPTALSDFLIGRACSTRTNVFPLRSSACASEYTVRVQLANILVRRK